MFYFYIEYLESNETGPSSGNKEWHKSQSKDRQFNQEVEVFSLKLNCIN